MNPTPTTDGQKIVLGVVVLGFAGLVYMMRPETEEEKRDYARRFGMPERPNPSTRFEQCVRQVRASAAERGYPLYSPEGVCAKAGRAHYGAKKFAAMAKAGKKAAHHG